MSNQEQIEELTADYRFLVKAVTRQGFFELYFQELPKNRTNVETFNSLNDRYFNLVGEYRYSDYNSFRKQLNRKSA